MSGMGVPISVETQTLIEELPGIDRPSGLHRRIGVIDMQETDPPELFGCCAIGAVNGCFKP
jgi:hypothetical protein